MADMAARQDVMERLNGTIESRGAAYLVLLDPDAQEPASAAEIAGMAGEAGVDCLLVGGSLSLSGHCHDTVSAVKSATNLPVVVFPGDSGFVTPAADAVLFLSLISGRNPQYLIGEQVRAAPLIRESGIEPISVGYMLVESGATTSVEFMSATRPLPREKPDIAMAHALAAQYMGMEIVFFDAGSGALQHVPPELVRHVAAYVDLPVMVGGGIRTPEAASLLVEAGASIVVTGDVIEKGGDRELLSELARAVHRS
jgi:phosphoglycerol geranylgeranyltransferase